MTALLLLFACLVFGMAATRWFAPPAGTAQGINWWVINVALPALVLQLIPTLKLDPQLWFPVVAMWLTFAGARLLFGLLGPRLGWSRPRIGALILVCGLGNTAYIGYPLIDALYGRNGLAVAVVADQFGTFPALASAGIMVASIYSGQAARPGQVMRSMLTFPPFVALLVGLLAGALGGWPRWLDGVLAPVGATLTPLALFSVGLQFRFHPGQRQLGAVVAGLGWKLLLAPLLCLALGAFTGVHGLVLAVGVLQAAMAPMVSAAILADEYALEPALANTLLGAGIALSLLLVPLGHLWLAA